MNFLNWKRPSVTRGAPAVADHQAEVMPEARASTSGTILQSDPGLVAFFAGATAVGREGVTVETALRVPAFGAAVSFLSRTLASIPLKVYAKTDGGREARPADPVAKLLGRAATDELSAFDFRRGFWQDVFTIGRGLAFIERNGAGVPINLWPLEVSKTTVERRNGRTVYHYRERLGARVTYAASEVLDICFMPGADRLSARSPVYNNAETIGLAQAITRYGARFFDNGGIPPFTITGPIKTPGGVARAASDLTAAVKKLAAEGGNALTIPEGHTLKELGIDPEKMQMVDTKRFMVEEIARIFGLPPVFLQDLTHGTFSNTEQQDLHLVKHLVVQWCEAFEGEANLKIWGREGGSVYAEHVLDGLMRGDLKSRTEANAKRINTGQMTINEVRETENRPPVEGGDTPLVQGAMIPAILAGKVKTPAAAPAQDEGQTNDER